MKVMKPLFLLIVSLLLCAQIFGCSTTPKKDLPKITLLYSTGSYHEAIAKAIQKMWQDQLGLDVALECQEWSQFQVNRLSGNYQIARHSLLAQYSNPLSFLDIWTSSNDNNVTKWSNSKYDELVNKAAATTNEKERLASLHEAEKLLMNDMPIIPLYFYTNSWLDNGKVENYRFDPFTSHISFTNAKKEGGSPIRYLLGMTPASLDPQKYRSSEGALVIKHCFEGLATTDINGAIVPGMAESWTTSEDGLIWTFKLRDANWSDGTPVAASDFVYAWQRAVSPRIGCIYSAQLWCIKNGKGITEGKLSDINLLGAKALDSKTLQVTLETPCGYFDQLAALPVFYPIRKDIVETYPDKWSLDASSIICNGPMILTKFEVNNEVRLEKNKTYWNKSIVTDNEVIMNLSGDAEISLSGFKTGNIDILRINSEDISEDSRNSAGYHVESIIGTYFLCINTKSDVDSLNDPVFRKTLSLALDRSVIAKMSQNDAISATGFIPPGFIDSNGKDFQVNSGDLLVSSEDYIENCDTARKLLRDAGYNILVNTD